MVPAARAEGVASYQGYKQGRSSTAAVLAAAVGQHGREETVPVHCQLFPTIY